MNPIFNNEMIITYLASFFVGVIVGKTVRKGSVILGIALVFLFLVFLHRLGYLQSIMWRLNELRMGL